MESEETLKQSEKILDAIAELAKGFDNLEARFNKLESSINSQFEAVRQGLVDNAIRFDRFEAEFYKVRSDISNLKADVREIAENRNKELV